MRKIYLAVLSVIVLCACNALNLTPTDRYDKNYSFKDKTNVQLYLNSFYPMTYIYGQFGSNALGGGNSNMSDGLTDILKYGAFVAGAGDCNLIMTEDGRQSVSQNYFDAWTGCYSWIRKVNEFLDGLESNKQNFSEEEYREFRAEALYYRAYAYFLIMRCHASETLDLGAVLYTDINQQVTKNKAQKRSTIAQTYDQILSDINFAVDNLPKPDHASGRLNRYAACALKARAMLYAKRYGEAKSAVERIIDSGCYSYIDDYSDIFKSLDNPEVIWGFGFAKGSVTHNFDKKYSQPGDICLQGGGYGSGYAGPTQEFVDMYDYADGTPFNISDVSNRFITNNNFTKRDPRLGASVLWNGAYWKGRSLECYEGGYDMKYFPYGTANSPGNTVTGYYMRKLLDESNTSYVLDGSYQPWIEFRFAEMMLIYAECLASEKDWAGAFNCVNELRKKRFGKDNVKTLPISDWNSALDVILKERAVELCFEGHRFWDLRRTSRAKTVLDGKKYTGVKWTESGQAESVSCEMAARRYPQRFDSFPIPQNEISNNTLVKQNPEW